MQIVGDVFFSMIRNADTGLYDALKEVTFENNQQSITIELR